MDRALADRLDRNYRWQRHVYDLTREHYLLGRDALVAGLRPPERGAVLEIGCGTASNLVKAAERYSQAELFGIDLSRAMLDTARRKLAHHPCGGRIRVAHGDAASFDAPSLFGRRSFERIFFSYALSMIPPWQQALRHAATHLAPGGSLHVVDFGIGDRLPAVANRALRAWLARFHVEPRDGLRTELARIADETGSELAFTELARSYACYGVLDLARGLLRPGLRS